MFRRIIHTLDLIIYVLLGVLLLTASNPVAGKPIERAHAYTRSIEFDYVRWSVNAALLKLQSSALDLPGYFTHEDRKQIVMQHLYLTERIQQAEGQLNLIYADPSIIDKEAASAHLRGELDNMYKRYEQLTPLAEATLQAQVGAVLADLNLTSGGQPVPPVLYHSSPVPMGLIISPRDHIEQLTNISVQPNLNVDRQVELEEQVDTALDVSSLVVPIGGVGVYPTMVMRTTSLPWQLDTVAHEWTHNFLTLRPLGFLYDATPELRTMNETTASIVGGEVGSLVLQRYYPELADAASPPLQLASAHPASTQPDGETPPFDFRAEMHITRVTVDEMLAEGKIEEAEAYMKARREIFWKNGYTIRKLNQAYFAFYGAYADVPGGAAGEDPVGPAVRALRAQSSSLADFVNSISWMISFEQLLATIQ
ncbi:MAG: hypothetical protein WBL25_11050 [Anaerolineales bacterium]